jgi:hypothetical protein
MREEISPKLSLETVLGAALRGCHDAGVGNESVKSLGLGKELGGAGTHTGQGIQMQF